VDILGFRGYVESLSEDDHKIIALKNILETVHNPPHMGLANPAERGYRTQSISDAVAISAIPTLHGLLMLFSNLQNLALALLAVGYFVRGAIARGR
jgi:hypothetical protein